MKREVIAWKPSDEENKLVIYLKIHEKTDWVFRAAGWVSDQRHGFWSEPVHVPHGWRHLPCSWSLISAPEP